MLLPLVTMIFTGRHHLGRLLALALAASPSLCAGEAASHWAYQPLKPVDPPKPDTHPIDAFIERRLAEAGLTPAPPAKRSTLIRRLSFDLHGLPPSPERVEAFQAADGQDAITGLIDELLASPRYGERWAQHWLDLVRYADTHGFEVNTERPNAWPYRDYVIRAFNEDRSYKQFILEQLAGDSTGEDAATGFLVASAVLLPGQIGKDEASKRLARQDSLDEIIVATGDTFLALSLGCARCHEHKFDPVSQRDYYAMQAFFAGVEYGERPLRNPEAAARLVTLNKRAASLRASLDDVEPLAFAARTILIDDEDSSRTSHLKNKNGHGANPPGTTRGYKDDPGSADHAPNLSTGRYTWWDNTPGEDVFTYAPAVTGQFRVWLSWGAHGSGVHTRDARYLLDADGDLATREDQKEIARVDQYHFAGVTEGQTEKKPLWSGLLDAGVHDFGAESRLVLRGGETGTAITADLILLQDPSAAGPHASLRPPVNALRNVEKFNPTAARFVRFTTHATINNNFREPCIDELEIFEAGTGRNIALGGTPTSSGNFNDPVQHRLEHINDGNYGNGKSWISNETGAGWVQIELSEPAVIDRVVWARDREGTFSDRLAQEYIIEVALEPGRWTTVARSDDRAPFGTPYDTTSALARNLPADSTASVRAELQELRQLEKQLAGLKSTRNVFAGKFRPPDRTFFLNRGDPEQKGAEVPPAIPGALGKIAVDPAASEQERRIALARWIASDDNPLTARVIANRVWQYHFGRGLVDTPSDFGLNGARPSHPELLDWLAGEFIRNDWSLKHLHRLILTSKTYQQASTVNEQAAAIDRDCRLLWRFPMRRLEAEAIRDSILMVSGNLNLKMGGPGFDFFKTRGGLSGFPVVEEFTDEGRRRMIYAHKVRMERAPVFGAFDCPDAGQATPSRSRAITALQALNLFNSKFVVEQAGVFARRVIDEAGPDVSSQLSRAFQLALGRAPTESEHSHCLAAARDHGLAAVCRALLNSNEFLFLP